QRCPARRDPCLGHPARCALRTSAGDQTPCSRRERQSRQHDPNDQLLHTCTALAERSTHPVPGRGPCLPVPISSSVCRARLSVSSRLKCPRDGQHHASRLADMVRFRQCSTWRCAVCGLGICHKNEGLSRQSQQNEGGNYLCHRVLFPFSHLKG